MHNIELLRLTALDGEMIEKSLILVEFHSGIPGTIQIMVPIINRISDEFKHKLHVVRVNTHIYMDVKKHYRIFNDPTYLLFRNGELVERYDHLISHKKLKNIIINYLN